jgi:hypothetical protein
MNARRVSGPQYKYQVRAQPAPHLTNFCHSRALGLRRCQCSEHAVAYGARPRLLSPRSTPSPWLLRCRRRSIAAPSTASPGARHRPWPLRLEHAVDLDQFAPPSPIDKIRGPVPKVKMGPMFMLIILYIAIEHTLQCIKKHTYYQIDA